MRSFFPLIQAENNILFAVPDVSENGRRETRREGTEIRSPRQIKEKHEKNTYDLNIFELLHASKMKKGHEILASPFNNKENTPFFSPTSRAPRVDKNAKSFFFRKLSWESHWGCPGLVLPNAANNYVYGDVGGGKTRFDFSTFFGSSSWKSQPKAGILSSNKIQNPWKDVAKMTQAVSDANIEKMKMKPFHLSALITEFKIIFSFFHFLFFPVRLLEIESQSSLPTFQFFKVLNDFFHVLTLCCSTFRNWKWSLSTFRFFDFSKFVLRFYPLNAPGIPEILS